MTPAPDPDRRSILFDANHFKAVNDTFGHARGDQVLQKLADQARQGLRTFNALGRYGGEEFLVVLPATALEEALLVAERMRTGIAEHVSFTTPDGAVHGTTVSLGVVQWREEEDLGALLLRVDEALYLAKAGGRNNVACVR